MKGGCPHGGQAAKKPAPVHRRVQARRGRAGAHHRPIAEVARELSIYDSALGNWVRQDRIDRGGQDRLSSEERARLRELERDNDKLRMERDLLKRTVARLPRSHYQQLWEQREVAGFIVADLAYDDERVAYLQHTQVPFVLAGSKRRAATAGWTPAALPAPCWRSSIWSSRASATSPTWAGRLGRGRRPAASGLPQGLAAAGNLPELLAAQSYGRPAVEQAQQPLDRPPRPTAVVAACDEFAYDTIRATASVGLAVGVGRGGWRRAATTLPWQPGHCRRSPACASRSGGWPTALSTC